MNNVSVGRLLDDVVMKRHPEIELVLCVGDLGILPVQAKLGEDKAAELVKCIVGQKPEKKDEVNLHLKDSTEVLGFLQKLAHPGEKAKEEKQDDKKPSSLSALLSTDPINT